MIKIGKITIYDEDQEQAKDFWINKVGFVLKFEQPMGLGWRGLRWGLKMILRHWCYTQKH